MIAASRGHEGIVEQLLAAGASVDATGSEHQTALIAAAMEGHCGVLRRLLAAGAAIDKADADGYTALLSAASSAKEGAVQLLLDAGAAPNAHIKVDGSTALHLAVLFKSAASARVLAAAPGTDVDALDNLGQVGSAGCSAS
jgi:ankyrin repeat protein